MLLKGKWLTKWNKDTWHLCSSWCSHGGNCHQNRGLPWSYFNSTKMLLQFTYEVFWYMRFKWHLGLTQHRGNSASYRLKPLLDVSLHGLKALLSKMKTCICLTEFSYWTTYHGSPLRLCNIISIKWFIFPSSLWSYEKLQFSPCLSVRCSPTPVAQCRSAVLWTTTTFPYHPFHQVSQTKRTLWRRRNWENSILIPASSQVLFKISFYFAVPFFKINFIYLHIYLHRCRNPCSAELRAGLQASYQPLLGANRKTYVHHHYPEKDNKPYRGQEWKPQLCVKSSKAELHPTFLLSFL